MIVPIVAYGDPVLKKKATSIDHNYPELQTLISNMFDTMYGANGIGLAAPQIGLPIRLFIVDGAPLSDDEDLSNEEKKQLKAFKKVFINPEILNEDGKEWAFNEGCLSIPDVREDVLRKPNLTLKYQDEDFNLHTEKFEGIAARIIQHEYDHIEGILFVDKLTSFKRRILKSKLNNISKGNIRVDYRMKFPSLKKNR